MGLLVASSEQASTLPLPPKVIPVRAASQKRIISP